MPRSDPHPRRFVSLLGVLIVLPLTVATPAQGSAGAAQVLIASLEQIAGAATAENVVQSLLASAEAVSSLATEERAQVVQAISLSLEAARIRQKREARQSVLELREEAGRVAIAEFTAGVRGFLIPMGVGILIYLALLALVRRQTRRLLRRAQECRARIRPVQETRLAEAEEALSGDAAKQARMEHARRLREKRQVGLERRANALELRARLNRTLSFWALTALLGIYLVWVFVAHEGLATLRLLRSEGVVLYLLGRLASIAVILLGANALMLLTRLVTGRIVEAARQGDPETMAERELRAQTLVNVANSGARIVLWTVAAFMILDQVGVSIAPLLAGAGVAGIAIGFGAQALVRDFLAGFFVLLENQFRVGDVVRIGDTGGLVERITLRATHLRDLSGNLHIIPNGTIDRVTNMTMSWSRWVADVSVSYRSDPDHVMRVLRDVGVQMRQEDPWRQMMLEDPEILGLDHFAESALVFKVLLKTKPLKQWAVGREYNRRIKYAFDKEGIEIPFPERTLHIARSDFEMLSSPQR